MKIGILGGTFNPVHNGHLRHAVEVGEALGLSHVLLTPCASPPHKSEYELLPFSLRVEMLRAVIGGLPMLEVNTLEGELEGHSYTWASLTEWHRRRGVPTAQAPDEGGVLPGDVLPEPDQRPYFMMGAESFASLHTWRRGLELPKLAHLVMVPRGGEDLALFRASVRRFWPETVLPDAWPGDVLPNESASTGESYRETIALGGAAAGGGHCTFLPVPRLDISSTFIRRRWREGRSLAGLVPRAAMAILAREHAAVESAWL